MFTEKTAGSLAVLKITKKNVVKISPTFRMIKILPFEFQLVILICLALKLEENKNIC